MQRVALLALSERRQEAVPILDRIFNWFHHHPRLTVAFALVGSALLFYLPLVVGLRTFPDGDFVHHFLPFSLFQAQAIADLRLPLWNPFTYGGHPFLADTQAAALYPVSNALLALTLPWRGDAARLYLLQVEAILHAVLGGWFVYLLVAELTRVRWAALLAALTFQFSGYLVGYPPLQLAVLRTGVWLPLILWLVLRLARSPRPYAWIPGVAAAVACAFLAGHPQTFLHIGWVTAAWMILLCVLTWRTQGRRHGLSILLANVLAVLVAVALAAAQWLPSFEFTRLSVRAQADYAFASGGFPLRDTWQILLPGVFTQYSPIYLGVPALFLVAAAWVALRERWRRTTTSEPWFGPATIFFGAVALFGLLVSYGGNGPLFPLVYRILPGWNLFRGQERAAYLVALGLAMCAGIGATRLVSLRLPVRQRLALTWAAVVIALVYAFGLLYQLEGDTVVGNGRYLWVALFTTVAAVTVALVVWLPGWSDRRTALLLALTCATLFLAGYGINFARRTPQQAATIAPEVAALESAVAARAGGNLGLDGRVFNEFRAYEDYSMRSNVEDLWGSSPLRLARYASFADGFPLDRWWRLYGVEHVLTWRRDLFEPSERLAELPQTDDTTYLHRLGEFNPRAWVTTGVALADDDTAWTHLADHSFDIENSAILPPESGAEVTETIPTSSTLRLTRVSPERLEVTATLEQPGILVVAENWMPGWRVETERAPTTPKTSHTTVLGLEPWSVQRVDLSLVGVPLPTGESQFTLVYDPSSVRAGLWVSGVALLLVALGAYFSWRTRPT